MIYIPYPVLSSIGLVAYCVSASRMRIGLPGVKLHDLQWSILTLNSLLANGFNYIITTIKETKQHKLRKQNFCK